MRQVWFTFFAMTALTACDQSNVRTNQSDVSPNTVQSDDKPSLSKDPSVSISTIVSDAHYDQMLPRRVPFYSYEGFVAGGDQTTGFCATGDTPTRIRECAAFLANAAHETGGGVYITEIAKNKCPDYCDMSKTGACAPARNKSYYGRGWLQLSWNYNYCEASKFIYKDDGRTLVQDPDILEKDAGKATQASLWYWMTQSGPGTVPAHDCMTNGGGFGCTIRSINGALECNSRNAAQVKSRVDNYVRFVAILSDGKVEPSGRNDC